MNFRLIAFVAVFVLMDNGQASVYGLRKRNTEAAGVIRKAKDVLKSFDDELIEKLKPDLVYLTPEEQKKFSSDLQGVNIAAEAELDGIISERGADMSPKELVQAVVTRIMEDFEDAPWLRRIRNFSGKKLDNLVQEFVNKVDES